MGRGRDLVLITCGVQDDPLVQDHLCPESRSAEVGTSPRPLQLQVEESLIPVMPAASIPLSWKD